MLSSIFEHDGYKFFTDNFIARPMEPLSDVVTERFLGAGVYAIYYRGRSEMAYQPLSGTETPLYVGNVNIIHARR